MSETTLKKMAEILDLSVSTISSALKDHPDISKGTKRKVKELAALLEYEPNVYAINLRTNNSREFGVIVPDIANDFYQSFISSLGEEARLNGYSLIILQSGNDPIIELENLKKCKLNRMAGIFVSITFNTTQIGDFLKLSEHRVPVIFFDKVPALEACNKVCVDDLMAATLAAETLIFKKKEKVLAIFGNIQLSITQKRLKGFKETFVKYRPLADVKIYHADSTGEAFDRVMDHLNSIKDTDAIFCMSDEILIGVMRAIQTLELRPPADIGILAISEGFIPTFYYPQITYVETSGFKLAKMAFSTMLACLAGSSYVYDLKTDPVLVEGGSL